jgi:hypothetical protein
MDNFGSKNIIHRYYLGLIKFDSNDNFQLVQGGM